MKTVSCDRNITKVSTVVFFRFTCNSVLIDVCHISTYFYIFLLVSTLKKEFRIVSKWDYHYSYFSFQHRQTKLSAVYQTEEFEESLTDKLLTFLSPQINIPLEFTRHTNSNSSSNKNTSASSQAGLLDFLFIYLFCKWDLLLIEKYCFISVTWFYFVVFHLLKFLTWREHSTPLCHLCYSVRSLSEVGTQQLGLAGRQRVEGAPTRSKVPLDMTRALACRTLCDGHRFAEQKFQFATTFVKH